MLAHILKMSGRTVGLTSTDGVYIDGKLSVSGDMTGPVSAQMILRDPSVDAAVMETARGGMLRSGLGFSANATSRPVSMSRPIIWGCAASIRSSSLPKSNVCRSRLRKTPPC